MRKLSFVVQYCIIQQYSFSPTDFASPVDKINIDLNNLSIYSTQHN